MAQREIADTGLTTASLIFGGNVFGWTLSEAASFAMLDAWLESGFNAVDTADVYSHWVPGHRGGESERILGDYFQARGNRHSILLITKVGMAMGEGRGGLSAAHIERAVEDSLRRLSTDYIDIYLSHCDDPDTPMEETLEAYQRLIDKGKVRAIGASNFSAERLREADRIAGARGLTRYRLLQPRYNLYDRLPYETELAPVARALGLAVTPYFSLASGFLTGKYRTAEDLRNKPRAGMVQRYLDERGRRILAALDEVAEACGATPAMVALAWLLAQPTVTAPIVSATNGRQLDALIAATDLRLDAASLATLNAASEPEPKA